MLSLDLQPPFRSRPADRAILSAHPSADARGAAVTAPTADLAATRKGAAIAPALRLLKRGRQAVLVLLDSRRARVLVHRDGELTDVTDRRADALMYDLTGRGMARRVPAGGETAADSTDRLLERESGRMLAEVATIVIDHAGADGLVIVGGAIDAVAELRLLLTAIPQSRLADEPALPVNMSRIAARESAARVAARMTERLQLEAVAGVLDEVHAGGRRPVPRGTEGIPDTRSGSALHRREPAHPIFQVSPSRR